MEVSKEEKAKVIAKVIADNLSDPEKDQLYDLIMMQNVYCEKWVRPHLTGMAEAPIQGYPIITVNFGFRYVHKVETLRGQGRQKEEGDSLNES